MFDQGCRVVYGIHGVCNILKIEVRKIDRKNVEYYVLQPLDQPESRYYIPTQSPAAVSKMSPLLTRQEIVTILRDPDVRNGQWISDENQRKQFYKTAITSGDRSALISQICLLHRHRKMQEESGRKFHTCDENFLRDAEKLISGELSLVLDIPRNEVQSYMQSILG